MIKPAIWAAGIIGSASGLLHIVQDRAIYANDFPDGDARFLFLNVEGYRNPLERGINYENVYLWTEDGVKLHAWMMKQEIKGRPTMLFFHGNAGNMGMRMDNIEAFYRMGVNVFIISYRGYGESQGFPTEEGLMIDAKTVVEYVFNCPSIDSGKIFVFGRSLGGAVGIYAVSEFQKKFKFCGLVLENTFMSIKDVVKKLAPGLWPVSFFMRDQWPSIERISKIQAPILFISGNEDKLVLPEHMKGLREQAKLAKFIEVKEVEGAGHNNTFQFAGPEYLEWLEEFMCKSLGDNSVFSK